MIDILENILMGSGVSLIAASLISIIRKSMDLIQLKKKVQLKVEGASIDIDSSRIDELKYLLAAIMDKPQVFMAYAFHDKDIAKQIADDLRKENIRVWLAEEKIKPGESIHKKIEEGLMSSGYLVALLSEASLSSKWVKEEFQMALFRESSGKWPRVIPVLIDNVQIPDYLQDKLYVNLKDNYSEGLTKIVSGIKSTNYLHNNSGAKAANKANSANAKNRAAD